MTASTLVLVPFAPPSFALLAGWFSSERDAVQWGGPGVSFPLDAKQCQAMLDEGSGTPPGRLCWMAERDGVPVGHTQLRFDWRNGNAALSRIGLAPESRGQGLAVPMLRLVLGEAFAWAHVERVELNVYDWNEAARRTYARLGFVAEGVRRSSARVGSERWNTVVMGLLRAEWDAGATAR